MLQLHLIYDILGEIILLDVHLVTFTGIFSKIESLSLLSVNILLGEREKNKTYKSHIFSHYSVRGSIYIIMKIWISRFGKN